MSFLTGSSKDSWHPIMTADTTTSSYWMNWRVLLCAIWVSISITFSFTLIWKHEGFRKRHSPETQQESGGLYEDETWRTCLKGIHPAWLLSFRVFAFLVLLALLIATALTDGSSIFYYYTQWTFTSVTIYFGLGSLLSMRGCYQYHKKAGGDRVDNVEVDTEQGSCVSTSHSQDSKMSDPSYQYHKKAGGDRVDNVEVDTEQGSCVSTSHSQDSKMSNPSKISGPNEQCHVREPAGFWGYVFQIIFQMNAGAVMLTDCVFWFIIFPFLLIKDYNLNFLAINMHSINAVFLLGETALNCLRFSWFRIGYFCLWTVVYVIFQWILHACVKLWWPYPFLDLSSPYAPLWYLSVALMHIPCYGIFVLIMKLKHLVLSTKFPQSYQCLR